MCSMSLAQGRLEARFWVFEVANIVMNRNLVWNLGACLELQAASMYK